MSRDYEAHRELEEQEDIRQEQQVALISLDEFLEHIGLKLVVHETVKDKQ